MRLRDIVSIWRLDRGEITCLAARLRPTTRSILREIIMLPPSSYQARVRMSAAARDSASWTSSHRIIHSETGVGIPLRLSHVSQRHIVFAMDDAGVSNRTSPLSKQDVVDFVVGPTEETLPRHRSTDRLQLVLIEYEEKRFPVWAFKHDSISPGTRHLDACSATLGVTSGPFTWNSDQAHPGSGDTLHKRDDCDQKTHDVGSTTAMTGSTRVLFDHAGDAQKRSIGSGGGSRPCWNSERRCWWTR